MKTMPLFLCILFCIAQSYAALYYLSTSGNDGDDGSYDNPWGTLSARKWSVCGTHDLYQDKYLFFYSHKSTMISFNTKRKT